jgi:hypothetical protein
MPRNGVRYMRWTKKAAPALAATSPEPDTQKRRFWMHTQSSETPPLCQRGCAACYEGWGYLGELVENPETGEEVEQIEAVRCRRCHGEEKGGETSDQR